MYATVRFPCLDIGVTEEPLAERRIPATPWRPGGGAFVHGLGSIRWRRGSRIDFWQGEGAYCPADKMLRVANPEAFQELPGGRRLRRRIFALRPYLFAVDFSLELSITESVRYRSLVEQLLGMTVRVYTTPGALREAPLGQAGGAIGLRLASALNTPATDLLVGAPIVVVEHDHKAEILDSDLRRVAGDPHQVRLYRGLAGRASSESAYWLVRPSGDSGREKMRLARIAVLRSYSELEALRLGASSSMRRYLALEAASTLHNGFRHGDAQVGAVVGDTLAAFFDAESELLAPVRDAMQSAPSASVNRVLAEEAWAAGEQLKRDYEYFLHSEVRSDAPRLDANGLPDWSEPPMRHGFDQFIQVIFADTVVHGDLFRDISASTIINRSSSGAHDHS